MSKGISSDTPGEKSYVSESVTKKHKINMKPLLQNPELPTGCESVALTMVLNYYGFDLSKTAIADHYLPYSADNFVSAYVGNPRSTRGWGCFAPAITITANQFLEENKSLKKAVDLTGTSLEKLYRYVYDGMPVIVWGTMYMYQPRYTDVTYTENKKTYRWYGQEHCMVLCGYDLENNTVAINDPLVGMVERNASDFASRYNQMGKMAVLIQ